MNNNVLRKYTVIYSESIGNYGSAITRFVYVERFPDERLFDAINRAGYEKQTLDGDDLWDIDGSVTHIFYGHNEQVGYDE